jgi:hypothetical protein
MMFLVRRPRLKTLFFSTPGRSASASLIRWIFASDEDLMLQAEHRSASRVAAT